MSDTTQPQDNDRRQAFYLLTAFAMGAVGAVVNETELFPAAFAAEPQERYWVVPAIAAKLLELRPVRPDYVGPFYPGEDGQRYAQDDVMRGILTLLLRMNGVNMPGRKK